MLRFMKILRVSFCLLVVLLLTACGSRRVTLVEPFTLADGETVKVAGTDLKIQSEGVGREWDEHDEYAFVSLIVETGSVEKKISLYLDDERQINGYVIALLSANPFDDPPICSLSVTRP
jgi:hypothetical protein